MRILIAEDDLTSRSMLAAVLKKGGHEVVETANGSEAWDELQKPDAPKLAILDWMMPVMEGLEVVRRVRAMQSPQPPYTIMLTSKDEKADVISGLDAGADDYLSKPFDPGELQARVEVGRRMVDMQEQLAAQVLELEKLNNELQSDLAIAAEAQQATMRLLESDTPFIKCRTLFRPYGEVSGDFYDEFLNDSKDTLHAFLGDATGHGTSAALVSMMAKMGLSNMPAGLSTDEIIRRLNEMMASCVPLGKFVTGIYMRIDSKGVLTSSNAGHPPLLIVPEDGGAPVAVESNGMALGMVKKEVVPYKEHTSRLKPGDRVYIYTDGIVECAAGSDMFGEDRLASFLAENRSEDMDLLLNKLLEVLADFSGTDKFNDDVTMLCFQFLKSVA